MIEAAKGIGARRGIGLRIVLAEDFSVQTCVFLKVVAEGERLLAAVAATLCRLAVVLYQGGIYNNIENTVPAVVMIQEQNELLPEVLEHPVGSRGKLGLILDRN